MKLQSANFGDRLRALRLNSNKSQRAFADRCQLHGVPATRDMIASWETGRSAMPAHLVPFIAYLLNADVTDLLPNLKTSKAIRVQTGSLLSSGSVSNVRMPKPKASPIRNLVRSGIVPRSTFLAENERSPLDVLILSDTRATLMSMIRTLDRRNREPLLLYHFSGLKAEQIAAKLRLPVSNIQARLFRAYEKLRRLIYGNPEWRSLRNELRDQFPPWEEPS